MYELHHISNMNKQNVTEKYLNKQGFKLVLYKNWREVYWVCSKKHENISNTSNIKKGVRCKTCYAHERNRRIKLLTNKLNNDDAIILNSDNLKRITWQCICGNQLVTEYNDLIKRTKYECRKCISKNSLTHDINKQKQQIFNKLITHKVLHIGCKKTTWVCQYGHTNETNNYKILFRPFECTTCKHLKSSFMKNKINDCKTLFNEHGKGDFVEYESSSKVHWICMDGHKNTCMFQNLKKNEYKCPECAKVNYAVIYVLLNDVEKIGYIGQTKAGAVRFFNGLGLCHLNEGSSTYLLANELSPSIKNKLKTITNDPYCKKLIDLVETESQEDSKTKLYILDKIGFNQNSIQTQLDLDNAEQKWLDFYDNKMSLLNKIKTIRKNR